MGLNPDLRSAASLTVRSLLPNLLALAIEGETIEVGQSFADGRYVLGVRTPGLSASRRIGSILAPGAAQRVAEADVANLLNLAWFERIATNTDGSARGFVRR